MPKKLRVSKRSRVNKRKSKVMKKSRRNRAKTVKRRRQKAGASNGLLATLTIITLSKRFYQSLLDHINSFNCHEPDIDEIIKEMEKYSTDNPIYISAEAPNIGIITSDLLDNQTISINQKIWKKIINFIYIYLPFIKPAPPVRNQTDFTIEISRPDILSTDVCKTYTECQTKIKPLLENIIQKFEATCDITKAKPAELAELAVSAKPAELAESAKPAELAVPAEVAEPADSTSRGRVNAFCKIFKKKSTQANAKPDETTPLLSCGD